MSTSGQSKKTCRALHRLVESVKEIVGIYDIESFFLSLDQLHGNLSDIGAHQDLQKPNFVIPELLIKELWGIAG